jgi:hypothetical protein
MVILIIQQLLIITAVLPQVLIAGVLYLILAAAALVIRFYIPGVPFTLATNDALQAGCIAYGA